MKSGYLMVIVAVVEIITVFLFLIDKYQSLTLIVLCPVLFNEFLFYLFLDIAGIRIVALSIAMNVFLMFVNNDSYMQK